MNDKEIEKRLKKEKIIYCPKCSVGRKKVKMEKIVSWNKKYIIDQCVNCKGRFLDKDEMQTMARMSFWEYIKYYFR